MRYSIQILTILAALLLAACGGGGGGDSAANPVDAASAPGNSTPEPEPEPVPEPDPGPEPEPEPGPGPGPGPDPEPEPEPDPEPDPDPGGGPPPSVGDLPTIELIEHPYYATPPTNIAEEVCGPLSEWTEINIFSDEDVDTQLRGWGAGDRYIVNVHYRPEPYLNLNVKGASCVKVVGVPGPGGEKPVTGKITASANFKGTLKQGGMIVEGLYVSPGQVLLDRGERSGGDCITPPNDRQFIIIRDTDVVGCAHHSFITSNAIGTYLEIDNSHFEQASSHNAYIDKVAMAYVHDSTFASPGWGHALRCIAARCIIENVTVSNVKLDGTVLPDGGTTGIVEGRHYVGMHPLEVYTCGGEHIVRNVDVVMYREAGTNGINAASFRWRDAMSTCNLGGHSDTAWEKRAYGSDAWNSATVWPDIDLTVTDMRVQCVTEACTAWDLKSSWPIMRDDPRAEIDVWTSNTTFANWDALVAAIPDESWRWTIEHVLPRYRDAFSRGSHVNKFPLEVPPSWSERAIIKIDSISVDNPYEGLILSPPGESENFCWGEMLGDVCAELAFPRARVEFL